MFLTVLLVTKNQSSSLNLSAAALFPHSHEYLAILTCVSSSLRCYTSPFSFPLTSSFQSLFAATVALSLFSSGSNNDDSQSHLIRDMTFTVQLTCLFFVFNARDLLITLVNIKFSVFF